MSRLFLELSQFLPDTWTARELEMKRDLAQSEPSPEVVAGIQLMLGHYGSDTRVQCVREWLQAHGGAGKV